MKGWWEAIWGRRRLSADSRNDFTGQGIGLILVNGAKPVPVVLLENLPLFLGEPH